MSFLIQVSFSEGLAQTRVVDFWSFKEKSKFVTSLESLTNLNNSDARSRRRKSKFRIDFDKANSSTLPNEMTSSGAVEAGGTGEALHQNE